MNERFHGRDLFCFMCNAFGVSIEPLSLLEANTLYIQLLIT